MTEVVEHSAASDPGINALATRNGNELDVFLWNYHDADVPAPPAHVLLAVDGLSGAKAVVTEFRMDATHSNAYQARQQLGSPTQPTPEQAQQLEKAGALDQTIPDHAVPLHDGKVNLILTLPRQGVILVRLRER